MFQLVVERVNPRDATLQLRQRFDVAHGDDDPETPRPETAAAFEHAMSALSAILPHFADPVNVSVSGHASADENDRTSHVTLAVSQVRA